MRVRHSKQIWFVALGVFVAVFLFTFLAQRFSNKTEVEAASLANFDPGYIISDYQMGNYNSMTEAEIQAFLTAKNSCANTNYNYYVALSQNKNYTWHWENGHFVCLSEEKFGDGEVIGSGETAAHIIWQAAQDYKINPKVLIVLLQKETGLITDPIPNSGDYRKATGYGCPDTAACSEKYYGFKNQVRNAAALFRTVLDGGWTNYPLGNNYIQYNPNAACGGSVVNVKNLATSALYRYTPYQPNAGALTAGYGTASCGAYGNRNFYLYFEDWFGGVTDTVKSSKIPDGKYYIQSSKNDTFALDISANSSENGANIQLYEMNYSSAQQWEITYNSTTDDYNIKNVISGKSLDVAGAGTSNGTNVQIWESNGTCAQRWKIITTDKNTIKLISACSSKALDIAGGNISNTTNIQLWSDNGENAQKYLLTPVDTLEEEGVYVIQAKSDMNKVADINGGVREAKAGTKVNIFENNDGGGQRWKVEKTSDGYHTIINAQSGKVMDVEAAGTDDGTRIQIYDSNETCAQKWKVLRNDDDSYTFISACSNKILDLNANDTSNNSKIQIYSANNSDAQKWTMQKIQIIEDGEYNIVSALSANKVVDITANSNLNGTNIQLYDKNGTNAQKWNVAYDKNTDLYTITNPGTGKVLDVAAAGTWNGTNVQLYEKNGTCAQKWTIYKTGSKYVIASSCSELVLDVSAGSIANGANIQLYEKNGTNAQKWSFVK